MIFYEKYVSLHSTESVQKCPKTYDFQRKVFVFVNVSKKQNICDKKKEVCCLPKTETILFQKYLEIFSQDLSSIGWFQNNTQPFVCVQEIPILLHFQIMKCALIKGRKVAESWKTRG